MSNVPNEQASHKQQNISSKQSKTLENRLVPHKILSKEPPTSLIQYENYLKSVSRQKQLQLLKDQQKQLKTEELNKRTLTAVKQHEYLNAINNNQRHFNSNRSLCMARMHLLDDYLLVKIFSHLSTVEKLSLQFVCKKWHQIIWSSQNTYKLFNRIEIVDEDHRVALRPASRILNGTVNSSIINNSTTMTNTTSTATNASSLNKSWAASSTISKFFCRKKCSNQKKSTLASMAESRGSQVQASAYSAMVNADLVLKFLLLKLLNRQTYPLCLCVEHIVIKNNNRITYRGIDMIAQLCPELKHLSLRNCANIRTNSLCKLISQCENLKYLDLTGCYNISNVIYVHGVSEAFGPTRYSGRYF